VALNRVGKDRFITPLWLLAALVVSLVAEPSAATQAIAVGTLLLLPGAALLAFARLPFRSSAGRVVAAVALSVTLLMATSLVLSLVGPLLGVERPLDTEVAVPTLVLCGVLLVTVGALRQRDAGAYLLRGVNVRGITTAAISLVLPVLALLGAERLDAGASGDLAIVVTAATLLLLLAALSAALGGRRPPVATLLFAAVLATAYAVAARGSVLFGWDIQKELTVALEAIDRGRWVVPGDNDPYAAMLSLTGLPALIADVGRLTAAEAFRYVFPIFSALTVVGVHEACRRVAPRSAALGAVLLLVVGSIALPRGMQAIARQETAFLLVAALALVAFESRLSIRTRRAAVLAAGAGIAVAHYSTGYATAALIFATAALGTVFPLRRPEPRRPRVLSPVVATIFMVLVVGWNVGITSSTAEIQRLAESFSDQGLNLIPSTEEKGLLAAWLSGSDSTLVSVAEYHQAVAQRVAINPFIEIDPAAAAVQLRDSVPSQVIGFAPALKPVYEIVYALVRQGVLAIIIGAVVLFLAMRRQTHRPAMIELGLLAFSALGMVALLRISGSIALFYNPERGALHAAVIYAPLVAILIARLLKAPARIRRLTVILLRASLPILLTGAFALSPQFVGGSPSAAHASVGEEYERLAISRAEYATARWLTDRDDDPLRMYADRYGQIVLTSITRERFSVEPTVDPAGVDLRAYVYASRANLVEGRARGKEMDLFAVFSFPEAFYSTTRATVFATEETRVYR
jgi:uncharacterized membrane protein